MLDGMKSLSFYPLEDEIYFKEFYTDSWLSMDKFIVVNFICQIDWVIGWSDRWYVFNPNMFVMAFMQ